MDKQNLAYPYNGMLFIYKKEWNTHPCYITDEPWKLYVKSKKPDIKGHMLNDSASMKRPEQANPPE